MQEWGKNEVRFSSSNHSFKYSILSNIMFLHHPSWSLQLWLHLDQICISAEPLWWARMTSKGSHKVVLYSASGSSTQQVLLQNHQCSMDRMETCHSTPCYPMHNSHNLMCQTTKIHNQEPCPIYSKRAFFYNIGDHPLIMTLVSIAEVDMLYASLQHQLCSSKCKSRVEV